MQSAARHHSEISPILRAAHVVAAVRTRIRSRRRVIDCPEFDGSRRHRLPLPLNQVHPIHEVVHVDYFLPGCPPSANAFWHFISDWLAGRTPHLGRGLMHYD